MLFTKEHYDLMAQFEREFKHRRLDKEVKDLWRKGVIYQDGQTNELFASYRRGYALGKLAEDKRHEHGASTQQAETCTYLPSDRREFLIDDAIKAQKGGAA